MPSPALPDDSVDVETPVVAPNAAHTAHQGAEVMVMRSHTTGLSRELVTELEERDELRASRVAGLSIWHSASIFVLQTVWTH